MDVRTAVDRLKRGDIGGLETLVRTHQIRAVRTAYLIVRDRPLAEDVVQGAFVRAYEKIASFDAARPFGPWFMKIVVNAAIKAAKRRERTTSLQNRDDQPDVQLTDTALGPQELAEVSDDRRRIWAALEQLAPVQRVAIVQRYYLGMSEKDMAKSGMSELAANSNSWHHPLPTIFSGRGSMARRKTDHVDPTENIGWEQLELLCTFEEQRKYEQPRLLALFGSSVPERAAETGISERTLYRRIAAFRDENMLSLFDSPKAKRQVLPPNVRWWAIIDLKRASASEPGRDSQHLLEALRPEARRADCESRDRRERNYSTFKFSEKPFWEFCTLSSLS
ncbi:hypothetical protein BH23ACT11_BH23ACT11_30780 [soil metagenome]